MATRVQTVRAVLFDFDGTLIDTMGGFADVAGRLIERYHGWSFEEAREAYLRTSGIPFFQQLQILFPGRERNPGIAESFEYQKLKCYEGLGLDPDASITMNGLRERGIASVVSSNNYGAVVNGFLAKQDVTFDLVLGYQDNFGKGEEHFAFAAQRLQVPRSALLFVGDSVKDAEIAMESRVAFVAMLGTNDRRVFEKHFGPDPFPMIDRLSHLLKLVDGWAADDATRSGP